MKTIILAPFRWILNRFYPVAPIVAAFAAELQKCDKAAFSVSYSRAMKAVTFRFNAISNEVLVLGTSLSSVRMVSSPEHGFALIHDQVGDIPLSWREERLLNNAMTTWVQTAGDGHFDVGLTD